MSLGHFAWGPAPDRDQRAYAGTGRRAFFLEAGASDIDFAPLREGLSALLPVSVPSGGYLWSVQPIQSCAGSLGERKLRFLHGMPESVSRRAWAGGDFPVAGMHPVRPVHRGLPGKLSAFF